MHREMSRQEEQYFATKLANDPTLAAFLNNQVNAGQNFMTQAARLYVCERCESGALAHGSGYACPHCGFKSETRNTRVRDYLKGGFYR
jgi:anaerobic ribonucleoside-triphosphate reductase